MAICRTYENTSAPFHLVNRITQNSDEYRGEYTRRLFTQTLTRIRGNNYFAIIVVMGSIESNITPSPPFLQPRSPRSELKSIVKWLIQCRFRSFELVSILDSRGGIKRDTLFSSKLNRIKRSLRLIIPRDREWFRWRL